MLREEAFIERLVDIAGEDKRAEIEDFIYEQLHDVFVATDLQEGSESWG